MNFYEILNTLILALSIATILITLVAFILYQIKRLNEGKRSEDHGYKLESVFFKRFAPHIEEKIKHWQKENAKAKAPTLKKMIFVNPKLGTLFAILVGVLVITLTFGKAGKQTISEATLKERAEKIAALQEKGLLKKYSYSPIKNKADRFIASTPDIPLENKAGIEYLKDKNIVILTSNTLRESNSSKHLQAINQWVEFLNQQGLAFEITKNIKKFSPLENRVRKKADVYILPQFTRVNRTTKEQVLKLKDHVSFLFTGPVSSEDEDKDDWFFEMTGVRFAKNSNPDDLLASQFSTKFNYQYLIAPGEVLPLTATDNEYVAFQEDMEKILSFEVSHLGVPRIEDEKWVVKATIQDSLIWSSWDPGKTYTDLENHVFIQSLAHLTGMPVARMSWWPDNSKSVAVVSVDVEDEFVNISEFLGMFKKYKIPSTLFLLAELYETHHELISPYLDQLDIASHGDNHDSFEKQPVITQFNRLQKSRYIIEEYSAKEVKGFRPPYEDVDENTIDALNSNQFDYMFAGQQCIRLSPCKYGNGMILFPRVQYDDFALMEDRTLISPQNMYKAMSADIEQARNTGGGYFLSLHTQMFGVPPYLSMVDKVLKKLVSHNDMALTTFGELYSWWKLREKIEIEIKRTSKTNKILKVHNTSQELIKNINFSLYNSQINLDMSRNPARDTQLKCVPNKSFFSCTINKLAPGEHIETNLD